MRDTGCTAVFIKANFVLPEQFTGQHRKYYMINGSSDKALTAFVQLESPWFSGTVEALCPDSLVCDAIVENIRPDIGALAQTRSMSKDSKKDVKPLNDFESQFNLNVSPLEFKSEQQRAELLRTAWDNAKSGKKSHLEDLSISLKSRKVSYTCVLLLTRLIPVRNN